MNSIVYDTHFPIGYLWIKILLKNYMFDLDFIELEKGICSLFSVKDDPLLSPRLSKVSLVGKQKNEFVFAIAFDTPPPFVSTFDFQKEMDKLRLDGNRRLFQYEAQVVSPGELKYLILVSLLEGYTICGDIVLTPQREKYRVYKRFDFLKQFDQKGSLQLFLDTLM